MSIKRESLEIEMLRGYVKPDNPLRPLLDSLFLIDNGQDFTSAYYPKEWVEGFREEIELRSGKTLEDTYGKLSVGDIGKLLSSRSTGDLSALSLVQMNLSKWREQQGQTVKTFTATGDYFATGEGRTVNFIAARAYNAADFLIGAVTKVGGYYGVGLTVFEGLPPEDDFAASLLLSAPMRQSIEGLDTGNLDVHLYYHLNLS